MITPFFVVAILTTIALAGHKRVIIKVPQRTKHIYHHHVKKVPVYVLVRDKKPKILDDLECKDSPSPSSHHHIDWDEGKLSYGYPSYKLRAEDEGRERAVSPGSDTYVVGKRQQRHQQQQWIEDSENKGAFYPGKYNNNGSNDVVYGYVLDDENDDKKEHFPGKWERDVEKMRQLQPPAKPPSSRKPKAYFYQNPIASSSKAASNAESSSSYQYRIEHQ